MAGGKGEAASAVPVWAGYRISRIEAPAPVENVRSNNTGSSGSRDGDRPEVEARDQQYQYAAGSRGHGRSGSKSSGKGRRDRRGGGKRQASRSSGAGTSSARSDCSDRPVTSSKSGGLDRAVSSPRRNQHHQHHQPRGGGLGKNQTQVHQSSQHHRDAFPVGDPPSSYLASPRDAPFRGGRLPDEKRATTRGLTRAPRDAIHPPPGQEEQPQSFGKVERLQVSGRGGEESGKKSGTGASLLRRSIGRERTTTADIDPNDKNMLLVRVGHQLHSSTVSSESPSRAASDVGDGLASRDDISRIHHSQASYSSRNQHYSSQHAKGTCMSMCPAEETRSREAEGTLSSFEATDVTAMLPFRQRIADPEKTVKKYRRSAAGRDMHSPEQLRPLEVLQTTARYLVEDVFANACIGDGANSTGKGEVAAGGIGHRGSSTTLKAYLFVEDRLRAVRQDMTVQGIALTPGAAEVLKTAANFYVVSEYLMCDEHADFFDRHLHTRELQGVFSSLAELFFQARGFLCPREAPSTHGEDEYLCLQAVHALATAVHNCYKEDASIDAAARGQGVGRVFTTTVSKLCGPSYSRGVNINIGGTMTKIPSGARGKSMPPDMPCGPYYSDAPFRQTFPKMAAAIRLLGAVGAGDWSEFHRVLGRHPGDHSGESLVADEDTGSPFAVRLRCLCQGMLLPMRVHAIRAMNRSFGKGERVPLADLKRTLRMRDDAHAAGLCRTLSLPVQDETVTFKSVPVVWKTEHAQNKGFLPPPTPARTAEDDWSTGSVRGDDWSASSMREDDWVGLGSVLETTCDEGFSTTWGSGGFGVVRACEGCGGHGCSWCEEGSVSEGVGVGRRLWEAALAPA